jgi:hypothetical protein
MMFELSKGAHGIVALSLNQGRMANERHALKRSFFVTTTIEDAAIMRTHNSMIAYVAAHADGVNRTPREKLQDFLAMLVGKRFNLQRFSGRPLERKHLRHDYLVLGGGKSG